MNEREKWRAYVKWLQRETEAPIRIADIHGYVCPPEVVEEGKRRRAELGVDEDLNDLTQPKRKPRR